MKNKNSNLASMLQTKHAKATHQSSNMFPFYAQQQSKQSKQHYFQIMLELFAFDET